MTSNIRTAISDYESDKVLDPAPLHRRQVNRWTLGLAFSNGNYECSSSRLTLSRMLLLSTPAGEHHIDEGGATCTSLEGLHDGPPAPNILDVGVHVQDIWGCDDPVLIDDQLPVVQTPEDVPLGGLDNDSLPVLPILTATTGVPGGESFKIIICSVT